MAHVMKKTRAAADTISFDLAEQPLRELNQFLHHELAQSGVKRVQVLNSEGARARGS